MTKIYILIEEEPAFCESYPDIVGVFDTEEKAIQAAKEMPKAASWYTIQEWELNGSFIKDYIAYEE